MSFSELFTTKHSCREVEVEVTNKCNAKCIHCPPTRRLDHPSFMTVDIFKQIISKYNEYYSDKKKPKFIFAGGGEPLLNKHLDEFILLCNNNGYSSTLITNAQLLTEERLITLIESGIQQINVSMHAIKPDEYRMAMDLDYDTAMKNILAANAYIKNKNIQSVKLYVLCNELSVVSSTKEEIQSFWIEKGIEFTGQKPIWNRAGNLKDFKEIIKNEGNHIKPNFELPVWCLTLKYMDIIDTNGDYIKCSCDYFGESKAYGNIANDNLEKIYEVWNQLLDDSNKPDSCINCIKSQSNVFFNELSSFIEG